MCIFCDIVKKQAPASIVKEWEDAIAIIPLNPVTKGHILVIPKIHVRDALEKPEVTAQTMQRAVELTNTLLTCDYGEIGKHCNFITSVGKAATQSVFHLHIHIVPRHESDGLLLPWSFQKKE